MPEKKSLVDGVVLHILIAPRLIAGFPDIAVVLSGAEPLSHAPPLPV